MISENNFIEQKITGAVQRLLAVRVNEILAAADFSIPLIEFGEYGREYAITPTVALPTCERSEKERIIRLDAYSLSISFSLQEHANAELFCYAYSAAVCKAVGENPTLDGIADRAVITGKKYIPPKKPNCGGGWGLVLTIRITIENQHPCRFSI